MATSQPSTEVQQTLFAEKHSVSLFRRIWALIRNPYVLFIRENPLTWNLMYGRKNPQSDIEGPYFVIGAPSRQFGESRAVLASLEELRHEQSLPFLLSLRLVDASGNALEGAKLDLWQASGTGGYGFSTYALRGTCTTGHDGNIEILTVVPGKYGPKNHERARHIHAIIYPPKDRKDLGSLTTQIYICKANDEKDLGTDFVKYIRPNRPGNFLHAYSTVADQPAMELPVIEKSQMELEEKIHDWDALIQANGGEARVRVVAKHEIKLHSKSKWF